MNTTKRIILLGSSELLYKCARIVKVYYRNRVEVKVIDTAFTPLKRKYNEEFGDTGEYREKADVLNYLSSIQEPVIVLSVNNTIIFPKRIYESPLFTIVNLHHALLPFHPGRNAEAWTIYDEDKYGGITWHFISKSGIDTGDIIHSERVRITEDMTSLKLLKECEKLACDSLRLLLPLEKLDKNMAKIQPEQNFPPKKACEVPNDGYLDWDWSINKMFAFLRCMNYGILEPLGKPKCIWKDTCYIIKKYKLISNNDHSEKRILLQYVEEKNIEIIVDDGDKSLRLNVQPYSE